MFPFTFLPILSLFVASSLALPNFCKEKRDTVYSTPVGYGPQPFPTSQAISSTVQSTTVVTSTIAVTKTLIITSSQPSTFSIPLFSSSAKWNTTSTILLPASSSTPSSSFASTIVSSAASATPSPEDLAGVYICSDMNWSGECIHHMTPLGTSPEACTQLDGTASAIGPDEGFMCYFYTNSFCDSIQTDRLDVIALQYPGEANLVETPYGDYNDKVRSYQCLRI